MRRRRPVRPLARPISAALVVVALASLARAQGPEGADKLLDGVNDVAAPGTPSPLAVWSKEAWVVLVGGAGEGLRAPAVVAGAAGAGRFLALPHNGYFAAAALGKGETGRFLVNAVKWAAGPAKKRPRVAARSDELVKLLADSDCDAHALGAGPLAGELDSIDVICGVTELAPADVAPLQAFLDRGGGVIAGQCAWGWQQIAHATSLDANPLNLFFARYGVAWTGGFLGKVGEVGFATERSPPKLVHGDPALTYLFNHREPARVENERPMLQAEATITALVPVLPSDDALLRPRLEQWVTEHANELLPTPEKPLKQIDGLRRCVLAYAIRAAELAPPEKVTALPCAQLFPGEVPPSAPRVSRKIAIDTAVPRWHSTGLYAAPGEAISVKLPDSVSAETAGLVAQIGAHTDELYTLPEWQRAPAIVRRVALDRKSVALASPFGGLVYVDVPEGCALGAIEVEIAHVVEAPRFVLDRDTNQAWRETLRHRPGPWAELESGKIVVTVPSKAALALDDPEALMRLWDRAADAMADLVAAPRARRSPERFVADAQIAAGYMHSGYPIMTQLDVAEVLAGPKRLADGNWGLFHELGHNHQEEDWTFDGTGEVTNNVLCLFALETVCGKKPSDGGELFEGVNGGAQRIAAYLHDGAKFEEWKKDPFLALQCYVQVQRAFGWDVYRQVFATYRNLARREKPKSDDAKRDLWLVDLSRACKHDLAPFFAAWGIPTSEAAQKSVADLPEWMPEGFPPK